MDSCLSAIAAIGDVDAIPYGPDAVGVRVDLLEAAHVQAVVKQQESSSKTALEEAVVDLLKAALVKAVVKAVVNIRILYPQQYKQ